MSENDTSIKQLEDALKIIQRFPFEKVNGSLEIRRGAQGVTYRRNISNSSKKCVEKINISHEEARMLATKRYYRLLKPIIEKEIKTRKKGAAANATDKYKVFNNLPTEVKKLVVPIFADAAARVFVWERTPSSQNLFKAENRVFPTNKGDFVRSAEEQLIANELYRNRDRVLYKYENQLLLRADNEVIHPDFEIISLRTGNVYYLEHFGMLDKDDYFRHSFIERILKYERNGIFPRRQATYDILWKRPSSKRCNGSKRN